MKISAALMVLLVFSIALVSAGYDDASDKVTYSIKRGWNLISWAPGQWTPSSGITGTCGVFGENEQSYWRGWYIYSTTLSKFVPFGGQQSPDLERLTQDAQAGFFYPYFGGVFAYSSRDCEYSYSNYSTPVRMSKVAAGWQLVPKRLDLQSFGTAFESCEIVKFNQWDNQQQKWVYSPSKTSKDELAQVWESAAVGEVFAIKFSSDCELVPGLVPELPT